MEKTTERGVSSPNIIQVIEAKMRWVEYVARVGDRRDASTIFVDGKTWGGDHLEDLGASGRRIL